MKIKAIVMALLFSGSLLLANGSQGLDLNGDAMQRQIDELNINPLDPNLMREVIKALARWIVQ
ncbi:hypothetical protein [Helicobacter pylori]|uniref:hypothetical protein n=3 Tax=Helicobacter pylori TaxID=210 RepID=UPI000EAC04C7|nr:hypothetical protein [Helicobacter pylori]UKJ11098.1 hypothetical protein L6503_05660 [Helicobacter pylori]